MSNRIPYKTIVGAQSGDPEAMEKILSHYKAYTRKCSTRGNCVDENICQTAEAKLMYAVMINFDAAEFDSCFMQSYYNHIKIQVFRF